MAQASTITLNVDYLNDGTTTAEVYSRFSDVENRSTYIGASHVPEARDTMQFYRTAPTKNGNFKGVKKTTVKFTRDFDVEGVDSATTLTSPAIVEVNFSIPMGVSAADTVKLRQRVLALLDDDTVMAALNDQQMI